ncbi:MULTISPECIES: ABC transporter ATP-binding protein [Neorhizobium]|uniref:ABC transporter ATP-binding protein n=1 Tax=Neorhizobium TaxID=1525371 RepID=UPI000CF8EE60|nr:MULTISPECIES: sn-glycerol-3-phosphate ABC transporter ATP-binding protein UgpC [Neorhizobium]TCV58690.1 carbohydrate ABC transporter ATP-binding protein (CUT1 family) [Neorhizobium sp. S3-V5DH]
MATLSLQNVQKSYGGLQVLHGIDVELEDGGFLVLLGPSGCGKSTLLNLIAGLDDISAGDIRIDGRSVVELAPKDRNIAMVFQSYALYPTMTVERNIGFGLEMRGINGIERSAAVKKAADLLQISHLLDRRPANLSGGQRQRVAMGRAIVRNPDLFLFDEPLSNLDAKLRAEMRTEIKRLHGRLGTSVVYVTHDQIEAMTLGTKVAVMKGGYIQQFADPQTIYEKPANMFVAGFIGSPPMNFVTGTLTSDGRLARFEAPGVRVEAPMSSGEIFRAKAAVLGIRPEELKIADVTGSMLTGTIDVIEPTGPDTIVTVRVGDQAVVARLPSRFSSKAGDGVYLRAELAGLSLFDAVTEMRIQL